MQQKKRYKSMSRLNLLPLLVVWTLWLPTARAQEAPTATPKMVVETPDGNEEKEEHSGSAPIVAHFTANAEYDVDWTPLYEWRVYEVGKEDSPYLVRYDADFDYTFVKAGTSCIVLKISFVNGNDTTEYAMETPFKITASESFLSVPNAFSPNDDDKNDILRVKKDGYQSIIDFHGYVFNRWGKKLYEWKDITQGWNGKVNGHDAPEGVYFLRIDAKGADGRVYKIKKAVTLLREFTVVDN